MTEESPRVYAEFSYSPQEWRQIAIQRAASSPEYARTRRQWYMLITACGVLVAGMAWQMEAKRFPFFELAALLILLVVLMDWWLQRFQMAQKTQHWGLCYSLVADGRGLQLRWENGSTTMAWREYTRLTQTPGFVILALRSGSQLFLPKRAFKPDDLKTFVSLVRTALGDEGACTNCGYLLAGITSNVCPECGTPFRIE